MENNSPTISILILTYNHEKYIRQCLESILCQKVMIPYELVISDDASIDNTVKILREYQSIHSNIHILTNETNIGLIRNFEKGLKSCTGFYYATCAGDDYWVDEFKLQKQLEFLQNNSNYTLVYTDNSIFIEETGIMIHSRHNPINEPPPSGEIFSQLLLDNFISALTIFTYLSNIKNACKSLNLFNAGWQIEDYPIWLEISATSLIGYIPDITALHRSNIASLSSPYNRKKNFEINNSSYAVRFYIMEKYSNKVDTKLRRKIINNYNNFLYKSAYLLSDKTIIENHGKYLSTPHKLKYFVFFLAYKNKIIEKILRNFIN